jgi:hypothetical protein
MSAKSPGARPVHFRAWPFNDIGDPIGSFDRRDNGRTRRLSRPRCRLPATGSGPTRRSNRRRRSARRGCRARSRRRSGGRRPRSGRRSGQGGTTGRVGMTVLEDNHGDASAVGREGATAMAARSLPAEYSGRIGSATDVLQGDIPQRSPRRRGLTAVGNESTLPQANQDFLRHSNRRAAIGLGAKRRLENLAQGTERVPCTLRRRSLAVRSLVESIAAGARS